MRTVVDLLGTPHDHLLTSGTADAYRRVLTNAVEAVAARIAKVEKPFSGVTPGELAPQIDRVDLDRPLGETAAAIDELHASICATLSTSATRATSPT